LCRRTRRNAERAFTRQGDRTIRGVLKVVVAVATFLATFAALMEIFDTRRGTTEERGAGRSGAEEASAPEDSGGI
jgi:hypothetical protein